MEKLLYASVKEMPKKAATVISNEIQALLSTHDTVVFAVAGGRSVGEVFEYLRLMQISWNRVHAFLVDERWVATDHMDSNYHLVYTHLLNSLITEGKMPKQNIHPFRIEDGISGYEKELKKYGGKFDIILVSAGEDGHVGALFPNHHSVKDTASKFFIRMDDSPKPPSQRMSMSRQLLLRSSVGILLVMGEQKREALAKIMDQRTAVLSCPAKLVVQLPKYVIISDIAE